MQPLNGKFEKAVQKVFERLRSMDEDLFSSELQKHENGEISRIIIETGALETFEMEGWDPDRHMPASWDGPGDLG